MNRTKKLRLFVVVILLSTVFTNTSFSQAGTLDSSFGVNGKVMTYLNTSVYPVFPNATAQQQDGKIIVAVGTGFPPGGDFVLMRYQTNGNLDSSFGSNGQVITHFEVGNSYASAVAIQPDGKIIEAGFSGYYFVLARFLSDGNLDSTFGDNGSVVTYVNNTYTELNAIVLQSDGKILAGGMFGDIDNACLIRYQPNGRIDSSFGINGQIRNGLGGRVNDIVVEKNGKIIVASKHWNEEMLSDEFATFRLLADGIFDSTFGDNGHVFTSFSEYQFSSSFPNSVMILKDDCGANKRTTCQSRGSRKRFRYITGNAY